jgi:methyl-accepting chemotaxis protein
VLSRRATGRRLGNEAARGFQDASALSERLSEFLGVASQTTLERISHVNSMTGREVLNAGEAIERVVGEAQAHVHETREALGEAAGTDGRAGVPELAVRQSEAIQEFLGTSQRLIAEQEVMAKHSERGCAKIAQLGAVIEGIAVQAKLLALNARIEATRLGAQGAALAVIASEMVRFSKEVGSANAAIAELAGALSHDLPRVTEHAEQLRTTTERFSARIGSELEEIREGGAALEKKLADAIQAGDERAQRIVHHAHAALSHLQFQDTCAQHLLSLEVILNEVVKRVPEAVRENRPEVLTSAVLRTANRNLDRHAGEVSIFNGQAQSEDSSNLNTGGELILF